MLGKRPVLPTLVLPLFSIVLSAVSVGFLRCFLEKDHHSIINGISALCVGSHASLTPYRPMQSAGEERSLHCSLHIKTCISFHCILTMALYHFRNNMKFKPWQS